MSEATLICFDEDCDEICRGAVELDDIDIVGFDPVFEGMDKPHHMKVEKDGVLYVCMSWRDYELGTPLTGSGANSNDFGSWEEFNEWVVFTLGEYADCDETSFVLYKDEIEPFER